MVPTPSTHLSAHDTPTQRLKFCHLQQSKGRTGAKPQLSSPGTGSSALPRHTLGSLSQPSSACTPALLCPVLSVLHMGHWHQSLPRAKESMQKSRAQEQPSSASLHQDPSGTTQHCVILRDHNQGLVGSSAACVTAKDKLLCPSQLAAHILIFLFSTGARHLTHRRGVKTHLRVESGFSAG